jgi:integrase
VRQRRESQLRHSDEFNVLDVEQVHAVARAAPDGQLAALFTVAAFTGLRQGEILALRDVVRDAFYDALEAAEMGHLREKGEPIVFHDLRHTFGTQCAGRGSTCAAFRRG